MSLSHFNPIFFILDMIYIFIYYWPVALFAVLVQLGGLWKQHKDHQFDPSDSEGNYQYYPR